MRVFIERFVDVVGRHYKIVAIASLISSYVFYGAKYILFNSDAGILNYNITSFAINYFEYGFTKRALVGSVIAIIAPTANLKYIAIGVNTAAFAALMVLISVGLNRLKGRSSLLLASIFALSPFTAFQLGFQLGRLDVINTIVILICITLINTRKVFLSAALAPIGILIHEAFVVYGVPLIFAVLFDHWKKNVAMTAGLQRHIPIITFTMLSVALTLLVFIYGENHLVAAAPGIGQDAWHRPLVQPATMLSNLDWLVIGSCLLIIYGWFINLYVEQNQGVDLFLVAATAPLMLFLLGWDYARWCSIIFTVMLIIVYLRAADGKWSLRLSGMGLLAVAFLIPLGPIGTTSPFPFLQAPFEASKRGLI